MKTKYTKGIRCGEGAVVAQGGGARGRAGGVWRTHNIKGDVQGQVLLHPVIYIFHFTPFFYNFWVKILCKETEKKGKKEKKVKKREKINKGKN